MNLDPKYTDTNKTASERIREARQDAEGVEPVPNEGPAVLDPAAYEAGVDARLREAHFQRYVRDGIPAERQADLDRVPARHLERAKRTLKRAGALVMATLAIGGGAAYLKATDHAPTPGAGIVETAWPNHPTSITLANGNTVSWENATEAMRSEAYSLAHHGELISDQP